MGQDGSVPCSWDLQSSGPARRQYAITARGVTCLAQRFETIAHYQHSIAVLLETINGALHP